jgi:Dolichyl-phosphate-mannose-protein mannosyltransferase
VRSLSRCESLLVIVFILSLPLSNPWVRGDGVGYYAFARSLLIEHRLDFTKDWQAANSSFRMGRIGDDGNPRPAEYTVTGHIDNHFSVGPAILWSPFLILTHAGVLLCDKLGGHIPADGFSRPYRVAMSIGTAIYGFLALIISFAVARRYVSEMSAFLGTLGIWFASSFPVYMYFNPSWSHAHSAFMVALFIWFWIRTRSARTSTQWIVLGAIGGLMIDVYYLTAILLLIPLFESLAQYRLGLRGAGTEPMRRLFMNNVAFAATVFVAFTPTLITKKLIYGGYLRLGYREAWYWKSPAFFKAAFSSDHGLFSWTPILILAIAGLWFLRRHDRALAAYLLAVFVLYLYAMGCFQSWDGLSSYGNRYFVSLTSIFVLGLAAFFDWLGQLWGERRAAFASASATALLALWNLGLIFQWGTHLIPARGPISWREAAYNQFAVVPSEAARSLRNYLTRRSQMMNRIEQEDVNQIRHR